MNYKRLLAERFLVTRHVKEPVHDIIIGFTGVGLPGFQECKGRRPESDAGPCSHVKYLLINLS